MNWKQAQQKARRVRCRHAIAAVIQPSRGKVPRYDEPAMVVCKEKVRQGYGDDACDENCPPGVKK